MSLAVSTHARLVGRMLVGCLLGILPAASAARAAAAPDGWYMPGANPQRTSWVSDEVSGNLLPQWYRPIEPYISQNVQIIATGGRLYVATARGLYCLRASDGEVLWVYATQMPLGHSPTVVDAVAYVGGFDRRIHAIDANTGKGLWTFEEAQAGYHSNPLVVDGRVYAGNRDGWFYAIGAHGTPDAGRLVWKYQTGGPINYSAAYYQGRVYFASMDLHGYCLDARSGELVWKTPRFAYTAGFQSIWPVVWAAKGMVVFCGNTPNYRGNSRPGTNSVPPYNYGSYHAMEKQGIYGDQTSGFIGAVGTESGDWAAGTRTIDMSRGIEYLQQYPHRRSIFVVDINSGQEYTFLHNGKPAYAPFLLWGTKQQSTRAAPAVGPDNVLYQTTHWMASGTFGRGQVSGWTLGSRFISTPNARKHNAWDEPLGFAMGGNTIYWSLCCDREMGSSSLGGQASQWVGYNLRRLAPGYDVMWHSVGDQDGTGNRLWGAYGSNNGIYHNHTSDQNPPIPHQGMVFIHRSNCVFAFRAGGQRQALPLAKAPAASDTVPVHSDASLKARLADEVRRMIAAGPLRVGYFDGGQHWNRPIWGDSHNDYFCHPGDTVVALLRALPHLPPDLQQQVRAYVQDWQKRFPMQSVAHIGWSQGAGREHFDLPPEVQADLANFGPRNQSQFQMWRFPPHSVYAMWKYAQEFGGAAELLAAARPRLPAPPPVSDAQLGEFCYVNNAYIAGYVGLLNLQKLAGQAEDPAVRRELDRLLELRARTFTKDTPWTFTNRGSHIKRMSVYRNYLHMTPELAAYLRQHALQKVSEALSHVNDVAPYWFVTHYEGCLQESNIQNLLDYGPVFQTRAWVLGEGRAELGRYLDVPAFKVGDLFHIEQLVTLLEAPAAPPGR